MSYGSPGSIVEATVASALRQLRREESRLGISDAEDIPGLKPAAALQGRFMSLAPELLARINAEVRVGSRHAPEIMEAPKIVVLSRAEFVEFDLLERLASEDRDRHVLGRRVGERRAAIRQCVAEALHFWAVFFPPHNGQSHGTIALIRPNLKAGLTTAVTPTADPLVVFTHELVHHVQFCATPWLGDGGQVSFSASHGFGRSDASDHSALDAVMEGHAMFVTSRVWPALPLSGLSADAPPFIANAKLGNSVFQRRPPEAGHYSLGFHFFERIVEEAGTRALKWVWDSPDTIPTIAELQVPHHWIQRMGLDRFADPVTIDTGPLSSLQSAMPGLSL